MDRKPAAKTSKTSGSGEINRIKAAVVNFQREAPCGSGSRRNQTGNCRKETAVAAAAAAAAKTTMPNGRG